MEGPLGLTVRFSQSVVTVDVGVLVCVSVSLVVLLVWFSVSVFDYILYGWCCT